MRQLDGEAYRRFILAGSGLLGSRREEIDALNVFPVPDGDTGANMWLTVKAACDQLASCRESTLTAVAEAVSLGSLMGARGNSGVILSQLFRGFAGGVEGCEHVDAGGLARAFQEGVDVAYRSVMRPVEGTMLTVARESAAAARERSLETDDILSVLDALVEAAAVSLERTPELLPVLKQAGVVDAGGMGLLCLFEGGLAALRTGTVPDAKVVEAKAVHMAAVDGSEAVGDYPYDSQLLIRGDGIDLEQLRSELEPLGDSLLVVGTPSLVKVHVHTLEPQTVLGICLSRGDIDQVEILDMRQQYAEFVASRQESGTTRQAPGETGPEQGNPVVIMGSPSTGRVGVVAVALGDGMVDIFRSLGAGAVVSGGQTMNPSIEDILTAINALSAGQVVVLPNNKNVIPAAQQAAELADRKVAVIPTRTIPQGLAALFALRPDDDIEKNLELMTASMSRIQTGTVTFAVRDAVCDNGRIQEGSIIGLVENKIELSGTDRSEVAMNVAASLVERDEDSAVITLFYGDDVSGAEAEGLGRVVSNRYPDHEVEIRYGGQPHYYYIISVE